MADGRGVPRAVPGVEASAPPAGAEVMRRFLEVSPFVRHLDMRLVSLEPDVARIELPFAEPVVTVGDVVHGGAIASLIDTTAMAASWSTDQVPEKLRGATVGMTVTFMAPARAQAVTATARVVRRGSSLCFCEVDVAAEDGEVVAKGLVTYRLG